MSASGELALLENVLSDLRADGFTVLVQPNRQALPEFLKDTSIDAIAVRGDKKIAIEFVNRDSRAESKVERLRDIFSRNEGWELRVIWSSETSEPPLPAIANSKIEKAISQAKALLRQNLLFAALLTTWSTFEAVGRALAPSQLARPQTPARLVNVLATDGHITPSEADKLRLLAKTRNRVVHGDLEAEVAPEAIADLIKLLELLSAALRKQSTEGGEQSR